MELFTLPVLLSGLTSFSSSVLVVLTKDWHGKHSFDTLDGVQKFHHNPTPRIGGISFFLGLIIALLISPPSVSLLLSPMLIAGIPAFSAGLLEDFTKRIGARERLFATLLSGFLAYWLTGYTLSRIEIVGFDLLLACLPLSVVFTALAVAGVANAINIIDGFNGLAGGTLIICFSAFGFIAFHVGDASLAYVCMVIIIVIAGFLLLNYPFGRIFMGDGGAYLMGFLLAWVAVLLPVRNAVVSKWVSIVICAYPIIETIFSIWRKHQREGYHPGKPDQVHFHMLVYRRVSCIRFSDRSNALKNALTSLIILPLPVFSSVLAVLFYDNKILLEISFALVLVIYLLIYYRLTRFRWIPRLKR